MRERYSYILEDVGFEKYKDKGVGNWNGVNIYILNINFN
jgi:hypothetical protein